LEFLATGWSVGSVVAAAGRLELLATGWSVGSVVAATGRLEFLATGWSVGSVVAAAGRLEFLATGWIFLYRDLFVVCLPVCSLDPELEEFPHI
jgi:hypothetical protein